MSSSLSCTNESFQNIGEWLITNRGGLAQITGQLLIPSQFLDNYAKAIETLNQLMKQHNMVKYQLNIGQTTLECIIYYPTYYSKKSNRCVVYHNPNCMTLGDFFETTGLIFTPEKIMQLHQCPMILYDYRGTGINKNNQLNSSILFKPTYDSIVQDGLKIIEFALSKFKYVDIWGSSLGGGVATVSLNNYLNVHPNEIDRVSLYNHDSFSTTPRVLFPYWKSTADLLGWIIGGYLDAETSMNNLISKNVKVTIVYHENDPVIREGAKMIECIDPTKVTVIKSKLRGHADISYDLLVCLQKIIKI
jgi:hypothetical protein